MCGRYQILMRWDELAALYHVAPPEPGIFTEVPSVNVAPTQLVPIVSFEEGQRRLQPARWGYPAPWLARQGKDPWSSALVNAKAEEAAAKPTWRSSLHQRRCLVPTTGFYEWWRRGSRRLPLLFTPPAGGILTLGGIWQIFQRDSEEICCLSILTTAATGEVASIHDRMPVILRAQDFDPWLDPRLDPAKLHALLEPPDANALVATEVSTAIGDWRQRDPAVLQPDWSREELG